MMRAFAGTHIRSTYRLEPRMAASTVRHHPTRTNARARASSRRRESRSPYRDWIV